MLACDLVVASSEATFGLPEVRRGLVAAGGGLMRLASRIPYALAAEWAMTGGFVTAARAREAGLVNRVTPPGDALAGALELAAAIAANGPLAVRATKRILVESPSWPAAEAFDRQREISRPGPRLRRRQGGRDRLPGEAQAGMARPLTDIEYDRWIAGGGTLRAWPSAKATHP